MSKIRGSGTRKPLIFSIWRARWNLVMLIPNSVLVFTSKYWNILSQIESKILLEIRFSSQGKRLWCAQIKGWVETGDVNAQSWFRTFLGCIEMILRILELSSFVIAYRYTYQVALHLHLVLQHLSLTTLRKIKAQYLLIKSALADFFLRHAFLMKPFYVFIDSR